MTQTLILHLVLHSAHRVTHDEGLSLRLRLHNHHVGQTIRATPGANLGGGS